MVPSGVDDESEAAAAPVVPEAEVAGDGGAAAEADLAWNTI